MSQIDITIRKRGLTKGKEAMKRLCRIYEKDELRDENVVICKDRSKVCFNVEAWLNGSTS